MADTSARIPFVASAVQFVRDLGAAVPALMSGTSKYIGLYAPAVWTGDNYTAPDDRSIRAVTSLGNDLSDDFGGVALDIVNNWDVFDGGLPANATIDGQTLTGQIKIGSGVTGVAHSVANSYLQIIAPVTAGAEKLFLSQQIFVARKELSFVFSKLQNDANLSVFVGFVEVDTVTKVPLVNAAIAADAYGASEFSNRSGVELAGFGDFTSYRGEAIGDNSNSVELGAVATSSDMSASGVGFAVEVSRGLFVSSNVSNGIAGNTSASSVSKQRANPLKLYKLAIRVRNKGGALGAPVTMRFFNVLAETHFQSRLQITGGHGDQNAAKAIAAYVVNSLSTTISGVVAVSQNGAWTIGQSGSPWGMNTTQLGGTAIDVNSGNKSNGTQRFVLATDQPNLTTPLNVSAAQSGGWSLSGGVASIGAVTQGGNWVIGITPLTTSGPTTTHKLSSAATTNATSVKATAGNISGGLLTNTSAAIKYFKLYQKATAPTVGTDTPTMTIPIPAGGQVALSAVFGAGGYKMATGIAYAITGAFADADTTAVAAGDVLVQLLYT